VLSSVVRHRLSQDSYFYTIMKKIYSLCAFSARLAMFLSLSSCIKSTVVPQPKIQLQDLYTTLVNGNTYTILAAAVNQAGLMDSLKNGKGPYTLFAPSDRYFAAYYGIRSAGDLSTLTPDSVRAFVGYHLFKGLVTTSSLPAGPDSPRVSSRGLPVYFTTAFNDAGAKSIFVNGTVLSTGDYPATNGLIQLIDGVLNPPISNTAVFVQKTKGLTLLSAALARANLIQPLSGSTPYTLFAPTDSAFRIAGYKTVQDVNDAEPAALSALLSCHLIRGRTFSSDFKDGSVIQTLGSASIKIGLNSIMTVSAPGNQTPALVVLPNRVTSNGAVFFINEVLKPGTGQSTSSYESGANEFGMGSYSANKIYRGQQSK